MLTHQESVATHWKLHHEGYAATLYGGSCDIVQRLEAPDGGGLISESLSPIQTTVPCKIVLIKQKTVDGSNSATVQRNYTLYLRDCVLILDNYLFTNFVGFNLADPNTLYEQVMETERLQTASQNGLFMYTVKGLKRIDKNE